MPSEPGIYPTEPRQFDPNRPVPVCRHFRKGLCLYGARCAFSHSKEPPPPPPLPPPPSSADLVEAQERYSVLRDRCKSLAASGAPREHLLAAAAALREQGEAVRALRPAKSASRFTERPRVRNKERAGALRRFLIDTYGVEELASGAGPLDSRRQAGRPPGHGHDTSVAWSAGVLDVAGGQAPPPARI